MDIGKLASEINVWIGTGSVAFLAIVIGFIKSDLSKDIFSSFFSGLSRFLSKNKKNKEVDKETGYSIKETDITNHDLFNYIDFWMYSQVPSMNLRTQYRTAVFRKYLHIYLKTYKEVISEFVMSGEYKDMDNAKLRTKLLNLLTNIIQKMEAEMRMIGVPDVIITKMKNVLNDRINLSIELINNMCDNTFYDTENNYLKIFTFLNIITPILDNIISSIENVCNTLNGELSGLTIDGFTEPMSGHRDE